MAVAVDDAEQIINDSGNNYTVPSAGSNPLLLSMWMNTKSSATAGTPTHTIGGQAFENNDGILVNGSGSPYIHSDAYWTTSNGTWPSTGSQTVVLTASPGYANEGICIVSLSGVDQTTPLADFQAGKETSQQDFTSFTITADDGDMVYVIYSCDSDGTINTPNAPGTNSWTDVNSGTSIIGGSMARHRVFRMNVSDDIVSQSIANDTVATESNLTSSIYVITQSVGGPSGRIMSSLAGAGGLAAKGGIAGPGGGLAGGAQCFQRGHSGLILPRRKLILPAYPTRLAA